MCPIRSGAAQPLATAPGRSYHTASADSSLPATGREVPMAPKPKVVADLIAQAAREAK